MFGVGGTSDAGATAADAPPTSENAKPAAPKTGTVFVTRFFFEACFTRGIVASSLLCENFFQFSMTIVLSANSACKLGKRVDLGMAYRVIHVRERHRRRLPRHDIHDRCRRQPLRWLKAISLAAGPLVRSTQVFRFR